MRDRLNELKGGGGGGGGDEVVEMGNGSSNDDSQMTAFFNQVNGVSGLINQIVENTHQIETLYSASLGAAMEEQVTRGTQEAENLMFNTNKIASQVRNKLKAMKSENESKEKEEDETKGGASVEVRLRSSQHSALSKKFVDVMSEYQRVQTQCKSRFKQRMERQYLIVKPEATPEEVNEALDSNQGQIFSQQFLATNQRAEAKKALKDIQDRHQEILKLEESLRELHQLFVDMQILVEAQGQMLNEIEKAVDNAVDYTEKGAAEMKKAVKYQKQSRKKMIIIICCLLILLLVILVPVLVTTLKK